MKSLDLISPPRCRHCVISTQGMLPPFSPWGPFACRVETANTIAIRAMQLPNLGPALEVTCMRRRAMRANPSMKLDSLGKMQI